MKRLKKFVAVVILVITTSLFSGCLAKLPVPEIKDGRFNFSFTYEMDGEIQTYSGVYVCKYDGVYVSCVGKGREWSGYIENLEGSIDIPIITNSDGVIYVAFNFRPEYFMGDPEYADYEVGAPWLYILYNDDDPDVFSIDNEDTLDFMAVYGVRILSYYYDEPIENTFKTKWSNGRFEFNIN